MALLPPVPIPQNRDFIRVGRSGIQGKGVFAKRRIPMVDLLMEIADGKPAHVYAFRLDDSTVIDGARGGNDSRFINHSCESNCEAYVFDDHLYIYAVRDVVRGEELTFDYQLGSALGTHPKKDNRQAYACLYGSPKCRGTMLGARRLK